MTLLWLSPVLLFLGLLASGRVAPLAAALAASLLALPVAHALAPLPLALPDLLDAVGAGAFVALPALPVILAGLFLAGAGRGEAAGGRGYAALSAGCLWLGPFMETATGFGVGYVVAVSAALRAGASGAPALALAAFSQSFVPWGALGIGTMISADLAGLPVAAVQRAAAPLAALAFLLALPLFWRIARVAGHAPTPGERAADAGLAVAQGLLLLAANRVLPVELAGLAALGPVLALRLLLAGPLPPAGVALRAVLPLAALAALLALPRLLPGAGALLGSLALAPVPGLRPFAPLLSPALPMLAAGFLALALAGEAGRTAAHAAAALRRGWRPVAMTLLLVILAVLLVRAGIARAVAAELAALLGPAAPAAAALAGALGGYLTGSNTGAGSLSMPVAAGFATGGAALAAAAVVAGSAFTALSPVRLAMGEALAGRGTAGGALRLLLPWAALQLALAALASVLGA